MTKTGKPVCYNVCINRVVRLRPGLQPRRSLTLIGNEMKARDNQRAKLYRADDALKPFACPLPTVKDVEGYTAKVWASKRVQAAYPKATRDREPTVKDGRGTRIARGGRYSINIPLWARNEAVVLHELAHTVTRRTYGPYVAGHGWEFCSVFLTIVLYMMGREAHDAFKASMKANRVKFRQPKTRKPMSEERKAVLVMRLAAFRLEQLAA